jgi:hypothetical protein
VALSTELIAYLADRNQTEADVLAAYAEVRRRAPDLPLDLMRPRLRQFVRDRLRARGSVPTKPMPLLFYERLSVGTQIEKVMSAVRSGFGSNSAQTYHRNGVAQSFGSWLRHGYDESREWSRVSSAWLRARNEWE